MFDGMSDGMFDGVFDGRFDWEVSMFRIKSLGDLHHAEHRIERLVAARTRRKCGGRVLAPDTVDGLEHAPVRRTCG